MTKSLIEGELIIAVDFDGTITTCPDTIPYEEMEIQPECARVLRRLRRDGVRLILWTCRTGPSFNEAISFLEKNDIADVWSSVNCQIPEVLKKYHPYEARKVGADLYIDDKGFGTVINWSAIEEYVYGGR